jgi:uncharacterized membrane protein YgdD (TMEM256/DUF423 family)
LGSAKIFLLLGSANALIAVLLGAFGAHGLKAKLTGEMMTIFQTGVQYHFYHSLSLIAVGLIISHFAATNLFKWSGWLMFTGILLFSGSLYILSISNMRWLGAITPFGGTSFIIAWLLLIIGIIKT